MLSGPFQNILIIKPSAAGDIVCALPVATALKQQWPHARVSWLVGSHLVDMVADHPDIDQVISFDRRRYSYIARSWIVTHRFLRFLRELRSNKFDLVIDLQGLFRSGFLAWATRAPIRIGPNEKREMGWMFYTHRLPRCDEQTHAVDRMCSLQELLDIDLSRPTFKLPITDQARQAAHKLLAETHVPDNLPYAVVAPGGTWQSKRWPIERFARLAEELTSKLDLAVIIIGSRSETGLAEQLVRCVTDSPYSTVTGSANRISNLTGQTTLKELMAILEKAVVVITNDSGPMHMAAALNRPVVAILGPTNPSRTGPFNQLHHVLQSNIPCAPCYKRQCEQLTCMENITVDQVMTVVKKLL